MKKYLVLIVLLFSAFVLAACGGNISDKDFVDRTDEVVAGTEVKIKFRVPSGVISAAMPDLIDEFHALYPNIEVELDAVSGGYSDVRRLTILDIQGNRAPTMVIGYPDHFAEYYSGRALVNLEYMIQGPNGFTQAELDDFVQSYLDEGRGFDDENPTDLFTFPFNKSTEVLVYNKTILDALIAKAPGQVFIPSTWEEMSTVSAKIIEMVAAGDADGIIQLATGEKSPRQWLQEEQFVPFAYDSTANAFITMTRQWGGAYTERVDNSKGLIRFHDNQNVINALKYFQAEATAGRYAVAETFSASYASDAFKALKTLMTVGSSAGVGYNVPEGGKFEVGIAKIPYVGAQPENKFVIQQGTNIAILAQSTNLQRSAAFLFAKFLMQPEKTAQFAMATGGYVPVRQSAYETSDYVDYLENPPINRIYHSMAAGVALNYLNEGYRFFVDPAFVGSSAVRDEVGLVFLAVIVNKRNVEDRLDQAYRTLGSAYR